MRADPAKYARPALALTPAIALVLTTACALAPTPPLTETWSPHRGRPPPRRYAGGLVAQGALTAAQARYIYA